MKDMESFISASLRWGVISSSVIIAIGLLLFFFTGSSGYPANTLPAGIEQVLGGAAEFKPFALIDLGLIMLILTPVLRVIVSIIASIQEKDIAYIFINTYVLAVLALSLFLGKAE